jgi:hypothetical protein
MSEKSVFLEVHLIIVANLRKACSHCACKECLTSFILKKMEQGKTLEVKCTAKNCDKPFTSFELKEALGKEKFEAFEKALFLESIKGSKSNFIQCPNQACGNVMEKLEPSRQDDSANETVFLPHPYF